MAADEVVETPFGKFLVDPDDVIGGTTKAGTLWDGPGFLQPIAIEYGQLGEEDTTILDVGANIGTFTVWLCHQHAWRVVAVEPLPEANRYLKANLDLNKAWCANRVVHLPFAAYDKRTVLYPQTRPGWSLGSTPLFPSSDGIAPAVESAPLDDFQWLYGERVSLIKIDAQGCDGAVLYGLQQTIDAHQPTIVFEWEEELAQPHGYALEQVLAWLRTRSYEVFEWPSQARNYLARPRRG